MTTSELDTIRKLPLRERPAALHDYINRGEARLTEARKLRDDTIRSLRKTMSRKDVALACGVSVAHVAAVTAKPK